MNKKKKQFTVAKEYRKNPLSTVNGGVTVRVEYHGKKSRDYVNVHKPDAYIVTLLHQDDVKTAYVLKEEPEDKKEKGYGV